MVQRCTKGGANKSKGSVPAENNSVPQQEISLASENIVVCDPAGIVIMHHVGASCSKRTLGSELLSAVQSQPHHINSTVINLG